MKSIFRKIAFVLALALVVTAFPAQSASAASKPSVKAKRTLYIGGDTQEQYSNKGWASVKNKGDYTVKFASDNEDVVTVIERNGRLTAVGVGTAKVTATFTKGSDVVESVCTVTVKQNAVSAGVNEESAKKLAALSVGDELTLVPTKTGVDADGNQITVEDPDKKVFTNGIRFKSSDEKVFTVDSKTGELKAVAEGTATLTVYGIQWEYDKEKAKWTTTRIVNSETEYEVVVQSNGLVGAEQKTLTTFEVKVGNAEAAKAITADNLVVEYVIGDIVVKDFVKSVAVSKTNDTVVVVELLNEIVADRIYQASYNDTTVRFTGVKRNPVSIEILTPSAVVEEEKKVDVRFYTAEGVDITTSELQNEVSLTAPDSGDYYINDAENTIYFFNADKTAQVTATYDMGWDDEGNERADLTRTATIVSISKSQDVPSLMEGFAAAGTTPDDKVKDLPFSNDAIRLAVGDTTYRLYGVYTITNGNNTTKAYINDTTAAEFKFSSTNEAVLAVNGNELYPNSAGSASVVVRDKDDKVVGVAKVIVEQNRIFTTFDAVPDKNKVSFGVDDKITVAVTAKDQMGVDLDLASATIEVKQVTTSQDNRIISDVNAADRKIFITAASAEETTKTVTVEVKVKIGDITKVKRFAVSTKQVSASTMEDSNKCRYTVSVNNNALDTKLGADKQATAVTVTVTDTEGYYLGQLADVQRVDKIPTKDSAAGNYLYISKGSDAVSGTDNTFSALTTVSGSAVSGSAVEVKKAANGTYAARVYTVYTTSSNVKTVRLLGTTSFTVSDSTVPFVASQEHINVADFENATLEGAITLKRGNDVVAWEAGKVEIVGFVASNNATVDSKFITKIKVKETVGDQYFIHEVSINKLFRIQ